MVTSMSAWGVLCVMLLTSLLHVNSQVNLLPPWARGNTRARGRSPELNISQPRGNCATYIDTSGSGQPTCAADEIVYFDLETCQYACGALDRLSAGSENIQH
ncbi:hypothetical protein EGW08_019886 [Elysia chlorotica]|uniref:BPTI/Kunitz inhibitor domain-containing protein n=1 Tax=Elysia chlorotica TaxID=188477 RepID=A0A433ST00_ELYCH|nr:hypothetical protein EGW08_019886 [Elysia chlorotica]